MTSVTNVYFDEYDVYCGRGRCRKTGELSIWGNPYSHKEGTLAEFKVATREEALARYAEWLPRQDHLMARLPELKNKRLACFCRPKKGFQGRLLCHVQIIVSVLENIAPESVS